MNKARSLVLVTGANGFVGSHLTEALLARGYRVRCMVRRSSDLTHVRDLPVEWVYADMGHGEGLDQACEGVEFVCHCAALTRAPDEETFLRVNAQGTATLAHAAVQASPNLRCFLFVSSQAAAGPSQGEGDVVDEARPPRPITWYGKSKWAAEQALQKMDSRLPWTIVRPSPVFGPRDRDFFAYFQLVSQRLQLQLGRSERWLSLIYVHDLVDLLLLAMESATALEKTYFGCGQAITYTELSQAIARALDKQTVRILLPEGVLPIIAWGSKIQQRLTGRPPLLNEQRVKDMQQRYWICSGEKARQDLGFEAKYDLDTAVRETGDWYRENGWL